MNTRAPVLFTAVVLAACSGVLGLEPLALRPDAPDGGDGTAPSDASGGDSAIDEGGARDAGTDGETDAAGCVADKSSDPKHCGRCGHDCLGAGCESGVCKPMKLADGLAIPEGLVVDDASVFVAEWDLNRVVRFGKSTTSPCAAAPLPKTCVFTDDQTNVWKPRALGIDATHVYWANGGSGNVHEIRSCPRVGCGGKAATLVARLGPDALGHAWGSATLPLDLTVRDGQVFWSESNGSAIRSAPVDGGAMTTYLESDHFTPVAIAVDAARIYFTDDTNQHATRVQSVLRSGANRDGGSVAVVASTPARPFGIALSTDDQLYWTVPFVGGAGDGLVQTAPKTGIADGGAPVGAVASSQSDPGPIIVDTQNVYWAIPGGDTVATGMIVYCPRAGCPADGPIVLASQQRVPRHLTQDDVAIYWSNEGLTTSSAYDGQVWKIAKP